MAEDKHFLLHCSPPRWPGGGRQRWEISPLPGRTGLQMCAGDCTEENSHFEGVQGFFFVSQSKVDSGNITLKWLFMDKRSQFVLWGTCLLFFQRLPAAQGRDADLWQQCYLWVCSSPALSTFCLSSASHFAFSLILHREEWTKQRMKLLL